MKTGAGGVDGRADRKEGNVDETIVCHGNGEEEIKLFVCEAPHSLLLLLLLGLLFLLLPLEGHCFGRAMLEIH